MLLHDLTAAVLFGNLVGNLPWRRPTKSLIYGGAKMKSSYDLYNILQGDKVSITPSESKESISSLSALVTYM